MDYIDNNSGEYAETLADELDAWFTVSGDADDFIFFGENCQNRSEK